MSSRRNRSSALSAPTWIHLDHGALLVRTHPVLQMGPVAFDLGLGIFHLVVRADEYEGEASSSNFGKVNLGFSLAGGAWAGGAFLGEGTGVFSVAAFLEAEGAFCVAPCCEGTASRTPPRIVEHLVENLQNENQNNNEGNDHIQSK